MAEDTYVPVRCEDCGRLDPVACPACAPARASLTSRYPEVEAFAALMLTELDANSRKGDRAGWMGADPEALLHDITWHWAKLAMAFRERRHHLGSCRDPEACNDHPRDWFTVEAAIREHAADVANMSLMFLDRLGLLPSKERLMSERDQAASPVCRCGDLESEHENGGRCLICARNDSIVGGCTRFRPQAGRSVEAGEQRG